MRFFQFVVLLLSMVTIPPFANSANNRVALVIGNSSYVHAAALINPQNDATDVADKLESLGFEVTKGIDLDFSQMRRTIRQYINKLDGAEIALFYYAGHGFQVNGENYMAPIDARLENENDLEFEAVPMSLVLTSMERNAKTNLVFLDACRNNPLARNLARSMGTRSAAVGRGLARIGVGVGSFISFATQPGNVAYDGEGRNSPFTKALVKHLGNPGEGITRSMVRVRNEVLQSTNGQQVPWDNSSLTGEVVLKLKIEVDDSEARKLAEKQKQNALIELAYWESIKNSSEVAYFKAYMKKYPNGQFLDLAEIKIKSIENERQASAAGTEMAQRNGGESEGQAAFDRTKLAKLNLLSAGTALDKKAAPLSPQDEEGLLRLEPEDFQQVQETLSALGYDVGKADGAFGPKSRAGLRKFQIRNRIEENGYLSDKTLAALVDKIEKTPSNYDGVWQLEFHRYNYSASDPSGTNLRTLLAKAKVRLRNGELFVVSDEIFSSTKSFFDTFRGRLSPDGKLTVSMSLDTLFGKAQVRDVRASAKLPKLFPFGRVFSVRGSRLWVNPKKSENVWLRLDIARLER
ncbi:spore cortex-lytic enzyme [Roseibium album]|nr:spore cortex-lytic enzyme [Roseibium album]